MAAQGEVHHTYFERKWVNGTTAMKMGNKEIFRYSGLLRKCIGEPRERTYYRLRGYSSMKYG